MFLWTTLAHASYSSHFMPVQGTAYAAEVDDLYSFLLISSLISFLLIVGGMVFFIRKYRRKSESEKTAYITHNHYLEFLWSFIPLVIMLFIFAWGWKIYAELRTIPKDAMEVYATGKKWLWTFEYNNGLKSVGELHVPVNKPIKLLLTSEDVIHSLYIPSFRIKQDAVPGAYNFLSFLPQKEGEFQIFCAEYCGLSHSGMMARVIVQSQEDYDAWLSGKAVITKSPEERGADLYKTRTCNTCHSIDGSKVVGPTFKGFWARKHEFEDGGSVEADENYVRESVLEPAKHIVKGFPNAMPSFKGSLSDDEINALIAFIKAQK